MANAALVPTDPSELGFPPTFPIELALREHSTQDVCEAYGIDKQAWDKIKIDPRFILALQTAVETLQKEGMSFKLKAKLQSEALLQTSWELIHSSNDDVPPNVKADLIKFTIRAAGLDASIDQKGAAAAHALVNNALQININLGD